MAGSAGKGRGNNQKVTRERVAARKKGAYLIYPEGNLAQCFENPILKVVIKGHVVGKGRDGKEMRVYPGDVLIDRLDWLAEMEGSVTVTEEVVN